MKIRLNLFEPLHEKSGFLHMQLISAFVYATWIVQSLFYLNPKFQTFSHLLGLYSLICVGQGQKPRSPVFSQRGSFKNRQWRILFVFDEKPCGKILLLEKSQPLAILSMLLNLNVFLTVCVSLSSVMFRAGCVVRILSCGR